MTHPDVTPRNVGWALSVNTRARGFIVVAGTGLNRSWWQGPESLAGRVWDKDINRWTGWWPNADRANNALRKVYGATPPPCTVMPLTQKQADKVRTRMAVSS